MPSRIIDGKLFKLTEKNLLYSCAHMPVFRGEVTIKDDEGPEGPEGGDVIAFATVEYYKLPDGRFYVSKRYVLDGDVVLSGFTLSKEEMIKEIDDSGIDADDFLEYLGDLPAFE